MPRKLPWKSESIAGGSKDKGLAGNGSARAPKPTDDEDLVNKNNVETADSDDSDEDNYRITESEFMDTARYFTKELHQQAYDRLLQEQQKEIDIKNSLADLLGQHSSQAAFTSSTLNHTILESKAGLVVEPTSVGPGSEIKSLERASSSRVAAPSSLRHHELDVPALKTQAEESESVPVEIMISPKIVKTTKLSDAAMARRQKRQQAQKIDSAVVPFLQ